MKKMKTLDASTRQLLKSALDKFVELEVSRTLDWGSVAFEGSNANDTDEDAFTLTLSLTRYTQDYENRLVALSGVAGLKRFEKVLGHDL